MAQFNATGTDVRAVIREGYCIGCGACVTQSPTARIVFNEFGELVADISACNATEVLSMEAICPFSETAPNESILAKTAFRQETNTNVGEEIGTYTGLYAGYADEYRRYGSSGGIVNWVLAQLLLTDKVDKAIVVGRSSGNERFFDYKVIDKADDLKANGSSFYYPVSYDGALKFIGENPGRYAITGVPCFHKALRLLKLQNPIIAERVVCQVGIVCGQMKSSFYLDYLSRKAGASTPAFSACFRKKDVLSRADDYYFECETRDAAGSVSTHSIKNRAIGASWAMGLFKPRACDFCDDVFAETADIAVMDAWLDRYVCDGEGTSLVITRTNALRTMLEKGSLSGDLHLEPVPEIDVMESQRGGLNHRRAGLRYRLLVEGHRGPVPTKRLHSSNRIDIWLKIEQRIRTAIREKSRIAMRKQKQFGDSGLAVYEGEMKGVLWLYKWFNRIKVRVANRHDYKKLFRLDV